MALHESKYHDFGNPKVLDPLWRDGGLNALTSLFVIMRDAENTANSRVFARSSYVAMRVYLSLSPLSTLGACGPEIYEYLCNRFFRNTKLYGLDVREKIIHYSDAARFVTKIWESGALWALSQGPRVNLRRILYWIWTDPTFCRMDMEDQNTGHPVQSECPEKWLLRFIQEWRSGQVSWHQNRSEYIRWRGFKRAGKQEIL